MNAADYPKHLPPTARLGARARAWYKQGRERWKFQPKQRDITPAHLCLHSALALALTDSLVPQMYDCTSLKGLIAYLARERERERERRRLTDRERHLQWPEILLYSLLSQTLHIH